MKTTRGKAQSAKACPVSDATHRDPRCLSAIISVLTLDGRPLEALRLFKWFQTSTLDPDEFTLSNALSLSANLSALDQGRQIQALVFKKNLPMDVAATNSLINLYFKCGSIADAEKVFDGMLLRDVYTWNNRNKTSSKTLPRFQKLYSRRKLLSTSSCSPRFIARVILIWAHDVLLNTEKYHTKQFSVEIILSGNLLECVPSTRPDMVEVVNILEMIRCPQDNPEEELS
ncbi:hypothetical protein ZIOFF_003710 [Zingiber officinale]|uniref:Pentatricopeptide repeat-containing protein n=1 Tax=Zingiber officinale TaxID=94328 RepID=A0A8J5HY27_ZINOF|nr:hypothetical protein ZIOFF_003710 [Zingiber officinale]